MTKQSAGILLYRTDGTDVQVMLVHPGGPFWAKKDKGVWSVPKGEVDADEPLLKAAKREFAEEVGQDLPEGELAPLGEVKTGGKIVSVWAVESDLDLSHFKSNSFDMEWPPKSGKKQTFPENDRAGWFNLNQAKQKLFSYQVELIDRLAQHLGVPANEPGTDSAQQSLL